MNPEPALAAPLPFCPLCGRYVGAGRACRCGWQRAQPIAEPGSALWEVGLGTALCRGLCLADGRVLAGGEDGRLRRVSALDGAQQQPLDLRSPIPARPAAEKERVIVGTKAGAVMAFSVRDGTPLWPGPYRVDASASGAPAISRGVVYFGDAVGRLHALDLRDGRPVWRKPFQAHKHIGAAPVPALSGDLVVVGDYGGYLYAVSALEGKALWERSLDDRITREAAVLGRWVYAGTASGRLFRVELLSGTIDPGFSFAARDAISTGLVPGADARLLYAGSCDGTLYAADTQTGAVRGRFEAGSDVGATPVLFGGLIFGGSNGGHVFALDAASLRKAWEFPAGSPVAGVAEEDGVVFAATRSGTLVALPWHLGRWAWGAQWLERQGQLELAADLHALAGDETCLLQERSRHYEAARAVWRASKLPQRAARQCEFAREPAGRVAAEYEKAADIVHPRNPRLGSELYLQAAHWYDEAHREEEMRRCVDLASRDGLLPRLEVREFNFPPFEFAEKGRLEFDVHNFGEAPAADLWVRLGGELAKTVRFPLERPIPPHGRLGVEAEEVVPLGALLRIELQQGEYGPPLWQRPFSLRVGPPPAILADGDVGSLMLQLSRDAPTPRVRIKGDLGLVKVRVEETPPERAAAETQPFEWPSVAPSLVTEERELIVLEAADKELNVTIGRTAVILADNRGIGQCGPGHYTRSDFPELRRPLAARAPKWEALVVDGRPFLLAFRAGPFRTADPVQVGVELGLLVSLEPGRELGLWSTPGPSAGRITSRRLESWLQPAVDNVVQLWLLDHTLAQLQPGLREREGLTTVLKEQLDGRVTGHGLRVESVTALYFVCPGRKRIDALSEAMAWEAMEAEAHPEKRHGDTGRA